MAFFKLEEHGQRLAGYVGNSHGSDGVTALLTTLTKLGIQPAKEPPAPGDRQLKPPTPMHQRPYQRVQAGWSYTATTSAATNKLVTQQAAKCAATEQCHPSTYIASNLDDNCNTAVHRWEPPRPP
jgi:hypothetical protein